MVVIPARVAPDVPVASGTPGAGGRRRGIWRRVLPALLAVLALTLQGTGQAVVLDQAAARLDQARTSSGTHVAAPDTRMQGVHAALDVMNRALTIGDEKAYLSVVDPSPNPAAAKVRAEQSRMFRTLRQKPFADVRYDWADEQFSPIGDQTGTPPDPQAIDIRLWRTFWLKGWDSRPATEQVGLRFARRNGRWMVVGDALQYWVNHNSAELPQPWTVADVVIVTTKHTLVVGDRAHAQAARRLASRVEDTVSGVQRLWKSRTWNGRVVVYAVANGQFLSPWFKNRAATGGSGDSATAEFDAEVVAMTAQSVPDRAQEGTLAELDSAPSRWAGLRMVVAPTVLSYSSTEAREVIRHELTHLATAGMGGEAPTWLEEGAAEYTAYRASSDVTSLHRRGLPESMWTDLRRKSYQPDLVDDHAGFYEGSGHEVAVRYSEAWLAVMYIAEHYGEDTLLRFYQRATDPVPPTPQARETAALRGVLHLDRAQFEAKVGSYARGLRRHFV